ncbi:MAG: ketopantoate reductase family protein [Promethearchaeota archaeon]
MKILIVGCGIIGTIYGWALKEAGFDVVHFVRKGKTETLSVEVTLDMLDERKNHDKNNVTGYRLDCIDSIAQDDLLDYVIVPTNSYQVTEAIKTIYNQSPRSFFVIMSSNWEGTKNIDHVLPKNQYMLAYPDGGGTIKEGLYWTNLGSEIHISAPNVENEQAVKELIEIFKRADIKADIQENMVHWLWLHNAMSVPLGVAFMKYKDVKLFLKDKETVKKGFYATKEVLELCKLRGVDVSKYPETSTFKYPFRVFYILFKLLFRFNKSMQRFTAHAATSIQEVKTNYTQMMNTAKNLNMEMPSMTEIGAYLL